MSMVPPLKRHAPGRVREARDAHRNQFQATDMLCGTPVPRAGRQRPSCLDVLGFNYYYDNQWQLAQPPDAWAGTMRQLTRAGAPCSTLLQTGLPALPASLLPSPKPATPAWTAPRWLHMVGAASAPRCCAPACRCGAVCLYPIIDRPDWDHPRPVAPVRPLGCRLREPGPPATLHRAQRLGPARGPGPDGRRAPKAQRPVPRAARCCVRQALSIKKQVVRYQTTSLREPDNT
ncbi:MAG: hypothetical protein WKG07_30870 [Hymenobacter sp.]